MTKTNPANAPAQVLTPRTIQLRRWFKRSIFLATLAIVVGVLASSRVVRQRAFTLGVWAKEKVVRDWIGLPPDRAELDSVLATQRRFTADNTRASLERFYDRTTAEIRALFDAAQMDPKHAVIGVGRADNGFIVSAGVFAPDSNGRSYRLLPNVRSVWLRQVTLHEGPFGLFLVTDSPETRAAARAAGAIVDEGSAQTTNSWGLRGPEPDPRAATRGIVLGDSFMQGMFNGDTDTPPLYLEQYLADALHTSASVLNTGHIGYSPKQYFHTLEEYGPRFDPGFVVISVCPNDFGDDSDVIQGKGNDFAEARYWLGEILHWCRARSIPCMLVPAPSDKELLGSRKDGYYPGQVSNIYEGSTLSYTNPFDAFVDEHMRLLSENFTPGRSPLFNHPINDNHFSPVGAKLWAEVVGRRLIYLIKQHAGSAGPKAAPAAGSSVAEEGEQAYVVEPFGDQVRALVG